MCSMPKRDLSCIKYSIKAFWANGLRTDLDTSAILYPLTHRAPRAKLRSMPARGSNLIIHGCKTLMLSHLWIFLLVINIQHSVNRQLKWPKENNIFITLQEQLTGQLHSVIVHIIKLMKGHKFQCFILQSGL